jgi:membrane protein YqaA with SNARE-associated domain
MHPKFPMPPEPGIASFILRGYAAPIVALAALAIVAGIVAGPAVW